jgi:large subunit ribosomal protein L24
MQTITPTTKASKQRKMVYQAPDHRRSKLFAAPLSPELKASQGVKTVSVRSGDTVRVMRGDHKGFEGKVARVDRTRYRVYVEGLTREKVDGTTIFVPTHPSKVMITNLNLDDKWRKQILERKRRARGKAEKVLEKPSKKPPKEVVAAIEKAIEEKAAEKPPKVERKRTRRKAVKEPVARKAEKEVEEGGKEKRLKAKKPKTKRKATKKTEGET